MGPLVPISQLLCALFLMAASEAAFGLLELLHPMHRDRQESRNLLLLGQPGVLTSSRDKLRGKNSCFRALCGIRFQTGLKA